MSYSVVWNPDAAADVDDVWNNASQHQQDQILDALAYLNFAIGDRPYLVGESRQDRHTRVLTRAPVTIHYRVIERLGLVRVFIARVYRRSGEGE